MGLYSKKTKKGIHWYYQFEKDGKSYRGGGYRTKTEALMAEAERRKTPDPSIKISFKQLYDEYLAYAKHRGQSQHERYEKELFFKKLAGMLYRLI